MDTQNLTYDSAVERLQAIVARLEGDEAIPMEEYKHLAEEAKQLLTFCRTQLTSIEEDINNLFDSEE